LDRHVAKVQPCVEAGKAVLIDKPLAGNLADLSQLKSWAAKGARIAGGSSLRFCEEAKQWMPKPLAERGSPQSVICGCAVDEFNYGIHAYAMLTGILGSGAQSVQHLGSTSQRRLHIRYPDRRCGIVVVGQSAAWLPFYA